MPHLRKNVAIAAAPAAVWDVLGDLAATSEWIPGTVTARMEGATRICTTADGAVIRERITDYSPERRTYRYEHLEVPLPVRNSSGTFTVEPDENGGAVVVLDASFEALDPAAEAQIEQMYGGALEQALASLRRRVEDGRSWQAASAPRPGVTS
jgi:uncharacterized protein YndB with AHSA1/START domain